MRKRSRHVALMILGATAFTLAGCTEDAVDAQAFPDIASCKEAANKGGMFSTQACDAAFAEAEALHVETAPRYDSLAVCEQTHGAGACGNEAQATQGGSGSIFMPLMMGYLLGNMLGGGRGVASQPMYKTADGRFTNAAGSSSYSSNSGATKVAPSQFNKAPSTIGKPPMSAATAASRGGFGGAGTSASGG